MKKRIFLVLAVIMAVIFAFGCEEKAEKSEEISVVFLSQDPAMGQVKGNGEQTLKKGEKTDWVMAVPSEGFEFVGWSDGITTAKRENESFEADSVISACFRLPSSELPLFTFTMEGGNEVTSKTEYAAMTLSISNADDEFCLEEIAGKIRGRGNATWNMEKKSYRLKLEEKINLLGQGKGEAKDWILLANHCDQTLLRNYIAFYLGRQLSNIEYSSSGSFVEVVINGDYKGVYLLCEQVEVNKNRVNIEVDAEKLDTGYLIELDQYADDDEGAEEGVTFFRLGDRLYTVKSDADTEQMEFIKDYVTKVDDAIHRGKKAEIEALIDLPSCVDMYLLQEFMLNIDVGWSSFFMYKKPDGGKLYFGPVWDFDLAAGNDRRLYSGSHEGIYVADGGGMGMVQESKWYIALMKQAWFRKMVISRWEETKDIFAGVSSVAKEAASSMSSAAERNFMRWDIFGQIINHEPDVVVMLQNYNQHTKHLCSWLEKRYIWLDNYFAEQAG